jgi:hypothetical protein
MNAGSLIRPQSCKLIYIAYSSGRKLNALNRIRFGAMNR